MHYGATKSINTKYPLSKSSKWYGRSHYNTEGRISDESTGYDVMTRKHLMNDGR
jgi:hypothetical protein